jgi:hypothetical protein
VAAEDGAVGAHDELAGRSGDGDAGLLAAGVGVPEVEGAVLADGGDLGVAGGELGVPDLVAVADEEEGVAGGGVPDAGGLVVAGGDEAGAVGGDGEAIDVCGVAVEGAGDAAVAGVGGDPSHAGDVGEGGREGAQPGEGAVGVATQGVLGLQEGHAVGAGGGLGLGQLGGVAGGVGGDRGLDGLAVLLLGVLARAVGAEEGDDGDDGDEGEGGGGDGEGGAVAPPVAAQELGGGVGVGGDDLAGLVALEVVGEGLGGAVSGRGVAGHGLVDDRGELVGELGGELFDRPGRALDDRQEDAGPGLAVVGRAGGEQVVEHRADGVDVGALVDGGAAGLLGRHVRGVPMTAPWIVRPSPGLTAGSPGSSASARSLARPQSITTVSPNLPTRTLAGLRSRWMICSLWA